MGSADRQLRVTLIGTYQNETHKEENPQLTAPGLHLTSLILLDFRASLSFLSSGTELDTPAGIFSCTRMG